MSKPASATAVARRQDEDEATLRLKLNQETARIPWQALQRFFAQGKVIHVGDTLDLIDVAVRMTRDDTGSIESELDSGAIALVSNQQAKDWIERDLSLWAVVVMPWILVQEAPCRSGSTPTPVRA